MKKEMTLVEKIHNEFDTSVDKLKEFAEKAEKYSNSIEVEELKDIDKNEFLKKIGFSSVGTVKDYETTQKRIEKTIQEKNEKLRLSKGLEKVIENWSVKLPGYKIITYSQIIQICEKYGLVLGRSKDYIGNIPDKNLNDVVLYEKHKKHSYTVDKQVPLCSIECVNNKYCGYGDEQNYYICAPLSDFNKEDNILVGRELFHYPEEKFNWKPSPKIKDPIILDIIDVSPLNEVGFAIVTAWGDEAKDEMVFNGNNN
jgi:hypothetical protein